MGVSLGNLVPDHLHTLSLFSGLEEEGKRTRLSTTMDRVNYKYGTTYSVLCQHAAGGRGRTHTHRLFQYSGSVLSTAYRGRLAPSPTGYLHLGHARTFWMAQQRALAGKGTLILRNEDLDPERSRPHFLEAMLEDLRWLGFEWQEGPDVGGPFAPYTQSQRHGLYRDAWRRLLAGGWLYPCHCSRKDLALAVQAPHDDEGIYPGTCRPATAQTGGPQSGANWRFRVPRER